MIEWLPWLLSKSCYTNLKFFETLKDTPNTSEGFRFVAFLVLEILGWVLFDPPPPPWCLVWVPKPLVPEGLHHKFRGRDTRVDSWPGEGVRNFVWGRNVLFLNLLVSRCKQRVIWEGGNVCLENSGHRLMCI